ncbi:MAG: cyclic nucleotide-binding protein [Proteobacteria bacterium]|nr:cyclic nucleotide-binding protein [Pseudomonadota bacterium]
MGHWIRENFSFQDLQRIMFRLIERVELFNGMTQQELLGLLESSEKCTFEAGETIVREGGTGSFLYVIIEGQVSVMKASKARTGSTEKSGTELARLEASDTFGEVSLVDHRERSASVIAIEPCVLLRMSESECWKNPPVSAKIYRNLARIMASRLRDMDEAFVLAARPRLR